MGTRESILALRLIIEKIIRLDKSTFIVLVNIEKVFDNVNWEWKIMFKILKSTEVVTTKIKFLYQLYKNELAIVKTGDIHCWTGMYIITFNI